MTTLTASFRNFAKALKNSAPSLLIANLPLDLDSPLSPLCHAENLHCVSKCCHLCRGFEKEDQYDGYELHKLAESMDRCHSSV